MYISNGIAYAGEQEPVIKVCGVRPLPGHRLWLRFTTGEAKVFDFTPLLKDAGFAPLADEHTIDIAPEYLYQHSEDAEGIA